MKRLLIIALLIITGVLAARQYNLENMIEAGLANAYIIRQKNILLKNSDLNVTSAAWNLLPSADVAASRTNNNGVYSSNGSFSMERSLTLTEPDYFNYRSALINRKITKLDSQQAGKQLVYDIYSDWLDLAQLYKEIDIQQENLAVIMKIKDQASILMRLGTKTIYDVNQTEINVINTQLTIADLNNQITTLRADLFNLVKITDDNPELVFEPSDTIVVNPDFTIRGKDTFTLQQLQQDVRSSKLDKLQQKLGLLPSLYVSGSYNQHSVKNEILNFANYQDSYTLSAGLSWSLWTPWTKGSTYGQAANSLVLKQWQLDEGLATLKLDRETLQRDWNFLNESLLLNTRKAAQSKDNLRIAQEKYNLGTLSLIELEQARVDVLDAELAVNQITYQLRKKVQEWNLINSLPILDKY